MIYGHPRAVWRARAKTNPFDGPEFNAYVDDCAFGPRETGRIEMTPEASRRGTPMNTSEQSNASTSSGDGSGQDSYDEDYRFGRTPRVSAPCPFSTHQFARLLVLRGRIHAGVFAADDLASA